MASRGLWSRGQLLASVALTGAVTAAVCLHATICSKILPIRGFALSEARRRGWMVYYDRCWSGGYGTMDGSKVPQSASHLPGWRWSL